MIHRTVDLQSLHRRNIFIWCFCFTLGLCTGFSCAYPKNCSVTVLAVLFADLPSSAPASLPYKHHDLCLSLSLLMPHTFSAVLTRKQGLSPALPPVLAAALPGNCSGMGTIPVSAPALVYTHRHVTEVTCTDICVIQR